MKKKVIYPSYSDLQPQWAKKLIRWVYTETNRSFFSILLLTALLLTTANPSRALTPTPQTTEPVEVQSPTVTPRPTSEDRLEKIKDLRNRIASKVAELRKSTSFQKSAIGDVKSVEEDSLTVATDEGEVIVTLDGDSKIMRQFNIDRRRTVKLTDVAVGDKIAVWGMGEKDNEILGQIIIVNNLPSLVIGEVESVSRTSGTITVNTSSEQSILIDVETYTKIMSYETDTKELVKTGLSKIKLSDHIHIVGQFKADNQERMTAEKIVILPSLSTTNSKLPTPTVTTFSVSITPTATKKPSPTKTSVKKITPTEIP